VTTFLYEKTMKAFRDEAKGNISLLFRRSIISIETISRVGCVFNVAKIRFSKMTAQRVITLLRNVSEIKAEINMR
jgi:hypothetical protein